VNTNIFKLSHLNVIFIESIQFVYVNVYTLAIFNLGKIIMFQLFKRDLTIVVLVLKKLLDVTFFIHITKRLSFCHILINYESVKFFLTFSPIFLEGVLKFSKCKKYLSSIQFGSVRFG